MLADSNQINALCDELAHQLSTEVGRRLRRPEYCGESPIENLFIVALAGMSIIRMRPVCTVPILPGAEDLPLSKLHLYVCPQAQIEDMRVDFVILSQTLELTKAVVECDGHDFHERTKEQAERDRVRDRRLQALGYRVFRFTGRELNRSAVTCAIEVFDWASPWMAKVA